MDEPDVVLRFDIGDESDMRDLALLLAGGKEEKVALLQFFNFYLFTQSDLVRRLAGKFHINGAIGGRGQGRAIHARSRGASVLVGRTVVGSCRLDDSIHLFLTGLGFARTGAGRKDEGQKSERDSGMKKSVLRTFARQPHTV